MKILKFIAILIAILIGVALIAALMGPKNYHVERSKIINANDSITFNYVSKFGNWGGWSPWAEKDPNMKIKIEGQDGTVGAVNSWSDGNPDVSGTGSMTLTEVTPNSKVGYDLQFTEPMVMQSKGGFSLEAIAPNKTKVTWHDEGDIPFMQRAFMLFMDLDAMMGPDFERGLTKIDSLATIDQNILSTAPAPATAP